MYQKAPPSKGITLGRRFVPAEADLERVEGLAANHPAVLENRTLFPTTVVDPRDSPRLLISGANQRKIGKKVTKGRWAGMPIFCLTLEERATCPPCDTQPDVKKHDMFKCETSLCDICRRPGYCCIGFELNIPAINAMDAPEEVEIALPKLVSAMHDGISVLVGGPTGDVRIAHLEGPEYQHVRRGLPFKPLYKAPHGKWRFWCPVLDVKTGRCGDYENRPAICRDFAPASNKLCIEYVPPTEKAPDDRAA